MFSHRCGHSLLHLSPVLHTYSFGFKSPKVYLFVYLFPFFVVFAGFSLFLTQATFRCCLSAMVFLDFIDSTAHHVEISFRLFGNNTVGAQNTFLSIKLCYLIFFINSTEQMGANDVLMWCGLKIQFKIDALLPMNFGSLEAKYKDGLLKRFSQFCIAIDWEIGKKMFWPYWLVVSGVKNSNKNMSASAEAANLQFGVPYPPSSHAGGSKTPKRVRADIFRCWWKMNPLQHRMN